MDGESDIEPRGRIWLLILLFLVAMAAAIIFFNRGVDTSALNAGLQDSARSSGRTPRSYTVFYSSGVFSPTNIRIHAGDSVSFQNNGQLPIKIASSDDSGEAAADFQNGEDLIPKGSMTFTFLKPGVRGYRNFYDELERGTIIIRP